MDSNENILAVGSVAYDRIMNYPGVFSDHILPDHIHKLSVAFLIDHLEEQFGGTAGNVAYSLRLLGHGARIAASAGKDFAPYRTRLKHLGIKVDGILVDKKLPSSAAYVMTDKQNNQITGFYLGAMKMPAWPKQAMLMRWRKETPAAIISPTNKEDMVRAARDFRRLNIPFLVDPAQQIPALTKAELLGLFDGALALAANDYEIDLILKKTRLSRKGLMRRVGVLITTLGARGSRIQMGNKTLKIPAVKLRKVIDPTGAGDAYRAGLLSGIVRGYSWDIAGRIASLVGAYPVQYYGTQEHKFTWSEIKRKYRKQFNKII